MGVRVVRVLLVVLVALVVREVPVRCRALRVLVVTAVPGELAALVGRVRLAVAPVVLVAPVALVVEAGLTVVALPVAGPVLGVWAVLAATAEWVASTPKEVAVLVASLVEVGPVARAEPTPLSGYVAAPAAPAVLEVLVVLVVQVGAVPEIRAAPFWAGSSVRAHAAKSAASSVDAIPGSPVM